MAVAIQGTEVRSRKKKEEELNKMKNYYYCTSSKKIKKILLLYFKYLQTITHKYNTLSLSD
jgi:hypothetical protein